MIETLGFTVLIVCLVPSLLGTLFGFALVGIAVAGRWSRKVEAAPIGASG